MSQSLPKLDSEHQTLAHALDTTRHQIATRGIHIPDDEDEYYRECSNTIFVAIVYSHEQMMYQEFQIE